MKTRVVALTFVLVLLMIASASAFTPRGEVTTAGDMQAVAWLEGDALFVAIANSSGARERFTVEHVPDGRAVRSAFEQYTTIVPDRTVLLESVRLSSRWDPRWDGELTEIQVSLGRTSIKVPIQRIWAGMDITHFVAQADEVVEARVDLETLMGDRVLHRLVIDSDYKLIGTNRVGRISIASFSGGYQFSSTRNEITFGKPSMTLRFRTPMIRDVGLLTFGATHYAESGRREIFDGPLLLVYGSDYRFIDNTTATTIRK